jgi:hypothetical protein
MFAQSICAVRSAISRAGRFGTSRTSSKLSRTLASGAIGTRRDKLSIGNDNVVKLALLLLDVIENDGRVRVISAKLPQRP